MQSIKQTAKRIAVAIAISAATIGGSFAIANPATIVATSPVGRMEAASEATTYIYGGRTRVNLPDDVLAELNEWAQSYTARLEEWSAEEGEDSSAYYGGLEEGFSYALTSILTRLGYIDGTPTSDTLQSVPSWWDHTTDGKTFLTWENASFGELN